MKVLLFAAGGDIGGGKTHILTLARELSAGRQLRLVSFRQSVLSKEARALGIDTVEATAGAGFWAAYRLARAQVKAFKPDLIHCHGAKANVLGILLRRQSGVPVMTTVHSDPDLDYLGMPWKQQTYGRINKWAIRRMDYWVAVADSMRRLLIGAGCDPQRIFTVYNGLDFSTAQAAGKPAKEPEAPILIGIAARLAAVKDLGTVIRALGLAAAEDDRLHLSIAGTGEAEASLRALVRELGLEERVTFEGWVDDIRGYFKRVDINVLSSLSETFPYSLLEGAYWHTPAIATDVGGIPTLIEDGVSGFLFAPGDAAALADRMLDLSRDEALRRQLAEALFRKASSDFSLDRMKEDQQAIYDTVLRRARAGRQRRAILCGAYGRGNAGDEAILRAILCRLRQLDPDMIIHVMSRNPRETRLKEGVNSFYIFSLLPFFRQLKKDALFINGGGSLMQDVTSSRSLYFYLFTLWAAYSRGCKVLMYGCGIGPIGRKRNRRLTAAVLNRKVHTISLRDSVSFDLLKDMGVDKPDIHRSADPVLSLPHTSKEGVAAIFEREGIPADLPKIGICLRTWPTFTRLEAVAQAAAYAYENYGLTPVFLPIEKPRDVAVGRQVASLLSVPHHLCLGDHPVEDLIGMLGSMDLVLGMRLHALIFATAGGAPVIGLSYDVKVDSFIRDIGSQACLSLEGLTGQALCRKIDAVMAAGKAQLGQRTREKLKEMEGINGRLAAELLGLEGRVS